MFAKLTSASLKKHLKCLPALGGCLLIFGSIFFALLTLASRITASGEALGRATVAIVREDSNDKYLDMALRYISGLSSASFALDYVDMDEKGALDALKSGNVIAVALLPEGLIEGIMNGQNPAVHIIFSSADTLSSTLLSELSAAGCRMLSAAQASSLSAAGLYQQAGQGSRLNTVYDEVDIMNISVVLERDRLFEYENARPGMQNYIAAALCLLLTASHIAYSPALRRCNAAMQLKLRATGVSSAIQFFADWLCNTLFNLGLLLLLYLSACILDILPKPISISFSAPNLLLLLCAAGLISAFSLFLHRFFSEATAVLMQLILPLCMLLCCGALIPSAFIPRTLLNTAGLLPFSVLYSSLRQLLDSYIFIDPLPLLLWNILLVILTIAPDVYSEAIQR